MATVIRKPGDVLTSEQVAALFNVDGKTVTRWAKAGKIASFRTPGGHRRFYRADIQQFLEAGYENGAGR